MVENPAGHGGQEIRESCCSKGEKEEEAARYHGTESELTCPLWRLKYLKNLININTFKIICDISLCCKKCVNLIMILLHFEIESILVFFLLRSHIFD